MQWTGPSITQVRHFHDCIGKFGLSLTKNLNQNNSSNSSGREWFVNWFFFVNQGSSFCLEPCTVLLHAKLFCWIVLKKLLIRVFYLIWVQFSNGHLSRYLHKPFSKHCNRPVDHFLSLLAVLPYRQSLVTFSLLRSWIWHRDICFCVNCGLRLDIGIFS